MAEVVYGLNHFTSTQGILKILEAIFSFIGALLIGIDGWASSLLDAFLVGTAVVVVIAVILLILHVTKLAKPIEGILAFQIYFNIAWFVYLLIVSAVLVSKHYPDKYMAGGSFGIIVAILYLADAIDCYRIEPGTIFCIKQ